MMEPLLQVQNLSTWFTTRAGPARAVDNVSFDIYPGETYALVGESGSGKSVTALSIMQLLPKPAGYIAGGKIVFKGTDMAQLPPVEMRAFRGNEISMIFQEPMTSLNPVFTCGQQIDEVLRLHQGMNRQQARARGIEMLEQVGIPDPAARYDEYPHQLSGGMRQRVMIAMALACEPALLIADEPTTALDVTIQSQILTLIEKLRQETNTAVLLITHDMGVVRENAQRVGVMYAGNLVEEAPVDELFDSPQHPYTELLMRALPTRGVRGSKLETIKGMVPKATEQIAGCRFTNRCPVALPFCADKQLREVATAENHRVSCHLFSEGMTEKRAAIETELDPAPTVAVDSAIRNLRIEELKMHFPIRKGLLKRMVGHVKAVDGVSLEIRKGETLALVGESGCGKTTVGKSIIRLYDPSGGAIELQGEDITSLRRGQLQPLRRNVQFVFQDPFSSMNPRMRIHDILTDGMVVHGIGADAADRRRRAIDMLARVGLDDSALERYPHEFSGGQRQRIMLARALCVEPQVLICDEATSALDVSVQA
jgi:peptide/nickel transport system ATP-binding protein